MKMKLLFTIGLLAMFGMSLTQASRPPFVIEFSNPTTMTACDYGDEFGEFQLTRLPIIDGDDCEVEYVSSDGKTLLKMQAGILRIVGRPAQDRKYKSFEVFASGSCAPTTLTSFHKYQSSILETITIAEGDTNSGILTEEMEDFGWLDIVQPCEGTIEKIVVSYFK